MTPSKPLTPTERLERVTAAWFALARDFTYTGPHDADSAHEIVANHRPAIEAAVLAGPQSLDATQAVEPSLREALKHEIREALPDAHCGPEWRSRHAPECRQEDYEEVMLRLEPLFAAARSSSAPAELDAAWKEAEEALPEGWDFGVTMRPGGPYRASAAPFMGPTWRLGSGVWSEGPTPAAALRALARRLTSSPGNPA